MGNETDISKHTVLVLLVLTLVVSIVGTWTILSQPTTIYKTVEIGQPAVGEVGVDIGLSTTLEPVIVNEGGKISIGILNG